MGAGAPAKTENDVNAEGVYIFFGKRSDLFRILQNQCKSTEHYEFHACMRMSSVNAKHTEHKMRGAKPISTTFRKDEKKWDR